MPLPDLVCNEEGYVCLVGKSAGKQDTEYPFPSIW